MCTQRQMKVILTCQFKVQTTPTTPPAPSMLSLLFGIVVHWLISVLLFSLVIYFDVALLCVMSCTLLIYLKFSCRIGY